MEQSSCPFHVQLMKLNLGTQNDWWPNQLNLDILRQQYQKVTPPLNYLQRGGQKVRPRCCKKRFKRSLNQQSRLVASRLWPLRSFFIRMTWHAAGTYRTGDGRGGAATDRVFCTTKLLADNGNQIKQDVCCGPLKKIWQSPFGPTFGVSWKCSH